MRIWPVGLGARRTKRPDFGKGMVIYMTIRECYEAMGGDYEEVLARLEKEEWIQRFALKFLEDPNYGILCAAMEEGNLEEAFRAAHTLKGGSLNLGFKKLQESSHEITEALRKKGQKKHRRCWKG